MSIEKMIDDLIRREGGYVDHPADRGGPTMFGITEETARAYGYTGSMHRLPRSEAVRIYKFRYYLRPGFDKVGAISPAIAEEMFDTGVNMGPKTAAMFLQRCLNLLNRRGRDYGDMKVDGDIGPLTLRSLASYRAKNGVDGMKRLHVLMNCLQGARYASIAERSPSQEVFMHGWIEHRVSLDGRM